MGNFRSQSSISRRALLEAFKRGVGTGVGKDYKGWHTTENYDALAHSGKDHCELEGRDRHWLSETEEAMTYGAMRDPLTIGARENFPLTISVTQRICETLGCRHPQSKGSGRPLVPFTTDLLVTRSAAPTHIALSAKTRSKLRDSKSHRSLMVERAYWFLYDVPFFVVTESEVTRNILISLRTLRPELHRAEDDLLGDAICKNFWTLSQNSDWSQPLIEVVRKISQVAGVPSTEGMKIFKRLAWAGELNCDLTLGITPQTRNAVLRRNT